MEPAQRAASPPQTRQPIQAVKTHLLQRTPGLAGRPPPERRQRALAALQARVAQARVAQARVAVRQDLAVLAAARAAPRFKAICAAPTRTARAVSSASIQRAATSAQCLEGAASAASIARGIGSADSRAVNRTGTVSATPAKAKTRAASLVKVASAARQIQDEAIRRKWPFQGAANVHPIPIVGVARFMSPRRHGDGDGQHG